MVTQRRHALYKVIAFFLFLNWRLFFRNTSAFELPITQAYISAAGEDNGKIVLPHEHPQYIPVFYHERLDNDKTSFAIRAFYTIQKRFL
ncbi:MAG: hypothetical protein ACXV7F_14545, partial [Methylomonas sp.]